MLRLVLLMPSFIYPLWSGLSSAFLKLYLYPTMSTVEESPVTYLLAKRACCYVVMELHYSRVKMCNDLGHQNYLKTCCTCI